VFEKHALLLLPDVSQRAHIATHVVCRLLVEFCCAVQAATLLAVTLLAVPGVALCPGALDSNAKHTRLGMMITM